MGLPKPTKALQMQDQVELGRGISLEERLKVAEKISGALSPESTGVQSLTTTPKNTDQGSNTSVTVNLEYPWMASTVRVGRLEPYSGRMPEELQIMLSWLAERGTIKNSNAFRNQVISEATRKLVIEELQKDGVTAAGVKKLGI